MTSMVQRATPALRRFRSALRPKPLPFAIGASLLGGALIDGAALTVAAVGAGMISIAHAFNSARRPAVELPLAVIDPLTDLPGEESFKQSIAGMVASNVEGKFGAIIAFDIDRLKDINGFYGRAAGDAVLRKTAERLCVGSPASVFRLGGDRFAAVAKNLDSPTEAEALAGQLLGRLSRPFCLSGDDTELSPSASVGLAVYPIHGVGYEDLIRHAEMAVDDAKRAGGRRWRAFNDRLAVALKARKDLERELRAAIEAHQLELYYQPQIDLENGRSVSVEALLRWPHPERGFIPPSTFIPVAEASGLIRALGPWLIHEACAQAARWRAAGINVGMAINISAAQLRQQELPKVVSEALQATRLPSSALELEVTESLFVDPAELHIRRSLHELSSMGLSLAIDDFGTGYSSLAYLKGLPMDKIKIDKSFTSGIGREEADEALVRVIISLAKTFGKKVLAEGVETEEQHRFLAKEGCHEAQGYLFARPMPAGACTKLLMTMLDTGQGAAASRAV